MAKSILNLDDLSDDMPIRLEDACRLFFADAIKPTGFRSEARRGNLEIMRIAGKDFVTKSAIEEMKLKCRVNASPTSHPQNRKRNGRAPRHKKSLGYQGWKQAT